jgi:hypothetical protein
MDDRLRLMTNLPGRYYIEKWSSTNGKTPYFACRVQRISPMTLSLAAPIAGEPGDRVASHFEEFGVLRGPIVRRTGFGFIMSLDMSDKRRERLAARVQWLERHRNLEVPNQRRYRRIAPRDPRSTIILADGTVIDCFVIDYSMTGAAISADVSVRVGMPMALGTVVGRVVRMLDPGFAIEFIERLDIDSLEPKLIRPRHALHAHLPDDL